MLVLCGGALVAGMAASLAIPFVPFAFALTLAVVLGAGWAGLQGTGFAQVALSALALLVSTEVGYGLGLVGAAAAEGARRAPRRPSAPEPVPSALPDLHIGEKP